MTRSLLQSNKDGNHDQRALDWMTFWGGRFIDYHFIGGGHPDALGSTPHGITVVGRNLDHRAARAALATMGADYIFDGANIYIEIKNPETGYGLQDNQVEWMQQTAGPAIVVATAEDILQLGQGGL